MTHRVFSDEQTQCEGKIAYLDYDRAKKKVAAGTRVYRCPFCRHWHTGRSNKRVSDRGHARQLFTGFDAEAPLNERTDL